MRVETIICTQGLANQYLELASWAALEDLHKLLGEQLVQSIKYYTVGTQTLPEQTGPGWRHPEPYGTHGRLITETIRPIGPNKWDPTLTDFELVAVVEFT
jgi:hypothetical protein